MVIVKKSKHDILKMVVIAVLVATITILHFVIRQNQFYNHIVLRELYFLPILLGAFWFGVRGGLCNFAMHQHPVLTPCAQTLAGFCTR